ncbi:MAG: chromosomal replication initiator protein DnaA [Myxococcales bacterium]|nr:chromosomal replication initiator protein DnaA [Myxococcota bacterium]MDW8280640.1 chromosomal replication initiator protein DnaA [Myxococcales bacterium]
MTDSLDATDPRDVWRTAVSVIERRLKPQNFDLWFRPITCAGINGRQITLVVPNRFIRDWFENHYLDIVLEEIRAQTQIDYEVIWQVRESEEWPPEPAAPVPVASTGSGPVETAALSASGGRETYDLIPKYTFETFVVGPSNQLAEAAANAVAENPAGKYNPLFIYGGVGLGKTHLLHAIGHKIRRYHPDWRIVYLKTETFMNEYINLVRHNRIEEFRTKYREMPDVLLMDDIQYLGGKERTQDEFFHTFNALFESHRQIVVTADKYPHEIPDLEERIRSRFQWGLIADIQAPELETRIAILVKKAEYDHIDLPADVAYYLASNIKSNVRELEGLLIRVAAFASLQGKPITLEFAQETLKNFLSQSSATLTVEMVQKEVANYFNVKIADLKGQKRHQAIARPRQIAMYLARKLCKCSYPELGQKFGGKDHTTVLSACRKVESLIQEDIKIRHIVQEIERHLSQ